MTISRRKMFGLFAAAPVAAAGLAVATPAPTETHTLLESELPRPFRFDQGYIRFSIRRSDFDWHRARLIA